MRTSPLVLLFAFSVACGSEGVAVEDGFYLASGAAPLPALAWQTDAAGVQKVYWLADFQQQGMFDCGVGDGSLYRDFGASAGIPTFDGCFEVSFVQADENHVIVAIRGNANQPAFEYRVSKVPQNQFTARFRQTRFNIVSMDNGASPLAVGQDVVLLDAQRRASEDQEDFCMNVLGDRCEIALFFR